VVPQSQSGHGVELRSSDRPACNQSLYRLPYPGSIEFIKVSFNN